MESSFFNLVNMINDIETLCGFSNATTNSLTNGLCMMKSDNVFQYIITQHPLLGYYILTHHIKWTNDDRKRFTKERIKATANIDSNLLASELASWFIDRKVINYSDALPVLRDNIYVGMDTAHQTFGLCVVVEVCLDECVLFNPKMGCERVKTKDVYPLPSNGSTIFISDSIDFMLSYRPSPKYGMWGEQDFNFNIQILANLTSYKYRNTDTFLDLGTFALFKPTKSTNLMGLSTYSTSHSVVTLKDLTTDFKLHLTSHKIY